MARARAIDHDVKKANILDNASTLFVAEGFSRASMTQLAAACEISKSNLYHYYRDKEEILFSLLDEHMDEILLALQKAVQQAPNQQQLEALIYSLLELYQDADHKHRVLLNDLQVLPDEKKEAIRAKERLIVQYFKHAILLDYPSYAVKPQLLSAAAMTLLGSINWSFTWYKPKKGLTLKDFAMFIANTYRHGLKDNLKNLNTVEDDNAKPAKS